jgi:prevent-host-death family protein
MNIVPPKITVLSSREFNQDTARAKRAAQKGPVFITTRGEPTHVLMTKADYDRATAQENAEKKPFISLAEALAQKEGGDFDFEFPEFKGEWSLQVPEFDE